MHTPTFAPALDGFSLLDDALRMLRTPSTRTYASRTWAQAPELKVNKTETGWELTADLPGVAADAVELKAEGDRLFLKITKKLAAPEGFKALHQERSALSFERSFAFDAGLDVEKVSASLKEGLLRIAVPRAPETQPRAIEVKAG